MMLLATLALAGTLDSLAEFSAGNPEVIFSCTSATRALEKIDDLAASMGDESPARFKDKLPTGLFAPDTPITFAIWPDSDQHRLRFTTELPIDAAMLQLNESSKRSGSDWTYTDREGHEIQAHVEGQQIEIMDANLPVSEKLDIGRLLKKAEAADKRDGCSVLMSPKDKGKLPFSGRFLIHIPFEQGSGIFFAAEINDAKKILDIRHPRHAPADMRTTIPPEILVVLGVGLYDLKLNEILEGEKLRKFKRFRRALPIGDGTMLGIMETSPKPTGGLVVPMARKIPAAWLSRRVQKLLTKAGMPFTVQDKTHLSVQAGPAGLTLSFERGRILAASDLSLLAAMERGQGVSWLSGRAGELAAEYPLVLVSNVIPGEDGEAPQRLPAPISIAIGAEDGVVHGYFVLPMSLGELKRMMDQVDQVRKKRKGGEEDH